jgi:uncharacterized Zn-finger protein
VNCNQSFKKHSRLKEHLAEHHGQNPYQCDQCGKGFLRKNVLQQHLKTHQKDRFVCIVKECEFKCSKWSEWVQHRRTKHAPKCIQCGQEFNRNQALELHYRQTCHDGRDSDSTPLTLIRCKDEHCDKVFTRVTILISFYIETCHDDPLQEFSFKRKALSMRGMPSIICP